MASKPPKIMRLPSFGTSLMRSLNSGVIIFP